MIALIPARGGSKRIPGKNIHPFFGHPMIAYTISAAKNSRLFERVLVSTEDPEVAHVAVRYGAAVVMRPAHLASDTAGLAEVALHLLDYLGLSSGTLCQLMPNCPLRRSEEIQAHWAAFSRSERAFQISAVPFRGVYPHWSLAADAFGIGSWFFGEFLKSSQELPELVCPTGAIWWADIPAFRRQGRFYGEPFHIERMDPVRGMDIDTPEDLAYCDLLVRGLMSRDGCSPLEPVSVSGGGAP